ncbi:MAG: YdcF family protein [Deltaproteobacteria bacterium]|nr:YdcF family protein [Deltaproteobacteria bacterium]MBW1738677.1 YdcF family protein [Deltaproteobacteria bacterium]MBW1909215.1 YdcF family protein [Deltaproteobacteria bacterium]MBW2035024.1 YdcF family protein [Deltaproteobacteria bacterium]MBW2115504.1 YdcF family protein [Deltaproteobacteria bacterium]
MNLWSRLKMNLENGLDPKDLSERRSDKSLTGERQIDGYEGAGQAEFQVDDRPIEPEGRKLNRPNIFKWVLFLLFLAYMLVSYYHAPILVRLGRYLVVEHPIKKADLIVCLMGKPVERGLAAAEVYKKGLASHIFVGREKLPDGNSILVKKGVHYPEGRDLLIMMLQGLGVPRTACITGDRFVEGTIGEAKVVREVARKRGCRSLIIITSPTHARRAWLTYRKVFEKNRMKIMLMPSRYSNFKPEDWWKTSEYVKEVIIEYQKLLYYTVKHFW